MKTLTPLLLILLIQSIASLSLQNTAFRDEALYLWSGRQILHHWSGGPPTESFETYFSGVPYLYPVLGGFLDAHGGLEAARRFSLACMLATTVIVYAITRRLYSRRSALPAAAIFAAQGSVLFIDHFATYDALCLLLLALATLLALRTSTVQEPLAALDVGVALLLAVLTKYAGLLFAPVVLFLLAWRASRTLGWKQGLLRVGLALVVIAAGAAAVIFIDPDVWSGLNRTTLNRVVLGLSTRLDLVAHCLYLEGIPLALATYGAFAGWRRGRHLLDAVLLRAALLAPLYHIYKAKSISLDKHVALGLFFASPLIGNALTRLTRFQLRADNRTRRLRRLSYQTAICLLMLAFGCHQAHQEFRGWRNSRAEVAALRNLVKPGDRILAEIVEVPRYYLQDEVAADQWSNFAWFEYTDRAGRIAHGDSAYKAPVAEGYFNVVMLHSDTDAAADHLITPELNSDKYYQLVAKLPGTWIWRKKSERLGSASQAGGGQECDVGRRSVENDYGFAGQNSDNPAGCRAVGHALADRTSNARSRRGYVALLSHIDRPAARRNALS